MQVVKFIKNYQSYAFGEVARFSKEQAESLKNAGLVEYVTKKSTSGAQ